MSPLSPILLPTLPPMLPPMLPSASQVLLGICLYFGTQLVLAPVLMGFVDTYIIHIGTLWREWTALFGLGLACVLLLLYAYFLTTRYGVAIWVTSPTISLRPFLALFYGICCYLPTILLVWTGITVLRLSFPHLYDASQVDQTSVSQLKASAANPALFACTLFTVLFVAPIGEELLFRGLLLRMLLGKCGVHIAIACTSLLFAVLHFTTAQGWRNVEIIIALFLLAEMQGYLYERTKQLWAPIGLHITFNSASVVLLLYAPKALLC